MIDVEVGTSSSALHRRLLVLTLLAKGLLSALRVGRSERLWQPLFERGDVRKSVISGALWQPLFEQRRVRKSVVGGALSIADRGGRWDRSLTHAQRIDRLGHRSISEQVEISGSVGAVGSGRLSA
jgi:hypothetical protein